MYKLGFITQVIRAIERIAGIGGQIVGPIPRGQQSSPLFRKYISGLFYCGGKKRQYYAITHEFSRTNREDELLDRLEEEFSSKCSEMRKNYGYSEDRVFEGTPRPIWPEIEVGEL